MTNANHQEKPNRGSWLCGRLGQFTAMCAAVLCAFSVSAETYYLAGTDEGSASAMIGTGSYGWTDTDGTTTKTHNPSEGNDYVVAGNGQTWANLVLRTPTVTDKTFGGDSLTLKGKAEIKVKVPNNGVVTIPNLIIDGEAQIVHGDGNQTKAVAGAISVNEGAYLKLIVSYDNATTARMLDIRSSISGAGEIWAGLEDDKTAKTPFVKFSGSMADFTGKLTFQSGKTVASEVYFYKDLPGDPAVLMEDGFTLVGKPLVKFMSSGTLGYTRGVTLSSEVCEIYVDAGKTVQINGLVTGAAGFKKTGAGTLALASASPGLSGTITVAAGTLQLCDIKENALPNATVTVSSGATLDENGPVFSGRDMLLVTGEPSPLGVVSPAYGPTRGLAVGKTVACSAMAWTNAEETVAATCVGYKVYTNGVVYVEGKENSFTYEHPNCEKGAELVWQWSEKRKVVPTVRGSGSVSVSGDGWFAPGETATVTALPAEGRSFECWEGDVPEEQKFNATLHLPVGTTVPALTAVFAANVDKYCEYVETDGDGAANGVFVTLDYIPTWQSVVEVKLKDLARSTTTGLFCSRTNNGKSAPLDNFSCICPNGTYRWDYGTIDTSKTATAPTDVHTVTCRPDGLYIDGVSKVSKTPKAVSDEPKPVHKLLLFGSYNGTEGDPEPVYPPANQYPSSAHMQVYSVKIWDDNGATLKVDLRPCVDTDGKAALYDAVGKKLYYGVACGSSKGLTAGGGEVFYEGPDVLMISGDPENVGEVTPAYGATNKLAIGETVACSAPSAVTNAEGNVGYDCMGYKVYTNDVVYVEGKGNCFTYVHPDCETGAKLVWYWDFNSFTAAGGDWSDPANWSAGRVPTAEDNVVIDGKAVTAEGDIVAKSLVLRGAKASLTLGRTGTFKQVYYTSLAQPVSLTLAGSLAVTDGAKLYVYPGELEDVKTAFADTSTVEAEAAVIAKIYAAANIVSVGGDFKVSNGATVYPANALLSGVPVFFKVKGDFTLAVDALFDAKLRGWGWDMGAVYDEAVAAGFQGARRVNADGWKDVGFNLALGSGQNWGGGGGYGGNGMGAGTSGKADAEKRRNGYAYGYRAAPFLSGGPGGHSNNDNRGSGSICVFAEGIATVNGTLNADSSELSHGKASGGGIWIAGQSVSLGLDAVLTAKGGSVNSTYAAGGGGRIAIAQGLEQKDLDLFAAGEEPDGFTIDALTHAGVSVAGGVRNNDQKTAQAGTAVLVSNPNVFETVTVTANDTSVIGPAYGDQPVRAGVNHFEAPAYGADAADPEKSIFRYACLGYVLTNGAGETVAEGPDASFEATIVKGAGPYTLTWAWGPRESHIVVIRPVSELGTVSVDGVILESDFDAWFAATETKAFVVEPVEDAEFLVWRGDVVRGDERKTTLTITTDRPQTLRPVLTTAGEPKTCVWKSNAKGEWYDPANWTGGVIPSSADTAQLANGTCEVYGALEVGSIIQTGGTLAIASADEICVAGDWTMSGNAKLNVTAQPIDATHTFETGTTCVRVGGNLTLNGTAVLTVISDHWTGGSPVFRVGGVFTLAEGAKVTADGQGFSWRIAEGGVASEEALFTTTCDGKLWETMAVAPGNSYHTMGSYGGKGGGSSRATYGWANAPIHPGSPAGRHGSGSFYNATSGFGGGLIRIHAAEAVVAGTLTANGAYEIASVNYGCASGGGIWLTADAFDFAATAKLAAHGAYTSYGGGGGGRIAIGTGLTSAQVDALLTTGRCGRKAHGLDVFTNEFAEVTVNVRGGEADGTVEPVQSRLGTFSYYGKPKGMLIIIK